MLIKLIIRGDPSSDESLFTKQKLFLKQDRPSAS
jgi:hypothetical protein